MGSLWHKRAGVSNSSDLILDIEWRTLRQEELLVVRAKLWRLYSKNSYLVSLWRQGEITNGLPPPDVTADLKFFPAKVVRLR